MRCASGAVCDAHAADARTPHAAHALVHARLKRRMLLVLLSLLAFASAASAQTTIYHIRGNASAGSNNIWSVNPATGAETLVYTGYPGGNAATLAQRASDGMIFYAINAASGSNGAVYRFNPATPNVAPVLLGNIGPSTSGGNVSSGYRMAFLGNTLYFMSGGGGADNDTLYTVNQNTGQATPVATLTGTGNGGDMAFSGNTLYVINQNRQLYSGTVAGGAATFVGTLTFPGGATPGTLGLAVDSTGRLLVQTQSPSDLYAVTLPSLAASLIGALSGGTTSTGDLSSAVVPAPDLSITKTDGVTNTFQGATVTYTVVVKNNGTYPVTGTVTDTVPATLTGVTWTCAASAGSSCTAASGSGNSVSTSATLAASGTATYTISGTVNASSGTLANTATVAVPSWLTDATPANNTATDTDSIVSAADLSITKAAASTFAVGNNASYTLTVHNAGPQSATGTITVTDTLPAGLSYVSASGTGWTCSNASGTVTCTNPGPLASGANLSAITLSVGVAAAAAPSVSNTASVSNATFDPSSANNSSTATTNVLYVNLNKSFTLGGPNATPGTNITYTIAFSNLGGAAVQNLVIIDPDPASGLKISDNTDFKVGSVVTTLGSTGLTVTVAYSNDGGATYAYTPASGGGGAPAGYDRNVTHIRWSFTGSLSQTSPNNAGSVAFTTRIR
ncbi:MAG TPA: DUF11 domain-containing protein [Pyrinomonadaceae bacterium]|jgi:uncharacterized repeat protein (TIGR01451 family)|nr:DUF11 domain-containing protein [Pyrinomonadaceae bacterium]